MNIVLATEGARADMGGLGIVAAPRIARALSQLGHRVVMETFGPMIPGSEDFVTTDPRAAFRENLVAVTYPARGRYAFGPSAVPHVWDHVGRADFVMLHSLYSFAVLTGYMAARGRGKKYGVWPHGVLAPFQRTVSGRQKAFYDALFGRRILDDAAVLFFNAKGERDETAPLHLQAPSVIIPHGIELDDFAALPPRGAFRKQYLNGFEGPLLLYLGRLNAKKGLDLLVPAVAQLRAKHPDLKLALVGTGDPPEFAAQVQTWILDAGLQDQIVMPGLLTGDAKCAVLADADIFVLPSQQENFSFSMFEAMACRLPVVISNTLNFAPQVERYRAGLAVERTVTAFANALSELIPSPAAGQRMGEGGAQLAAQYSWQSVGKQMERAIEAIVSNHALPRDLVMGQAFS